MNDQISGGAQPSLSPQPHGVTLWNLFTGFVLVGLFGFGGIAAALFHVAVERRKWITSDEYTSCLALGQVLPGASLMNMTTIVADRFQGIKGVVLALIGLFTFPLLILLGLIATYDHYAYLPDVQNATNAAAAAAVGLTFGTGLKLAKVIIKSKTSLAFTVLAFVSIGLLKLPLLQTILVLTALAIWVGYKEDKS
jgi:chromate transporter